MCLRIQSKTFFLLTKFLPKTNSFAPEKLFWVGECPNKKRPNFQGKRAIGFYGGFFDGGTYRPHPAPVAVFFSTHGAGRIWTWSVFIHPATANSFMIYSIHLYTVLALISADISSPCSTAQKKVLVAHASCIQLRLHPLHNVLSWWFQFPCEDRMLTLRATNWEFCSFKGE